MRKIKYLVAHCTATPHSTTVESIKRYWKEVKKWKQVGYHFLIEADGNVVQLAPIEKITNGVGGFNSNAIHFCYIGGLKIDDRTDSQKASMLALMKQHKTMFPSAKIQGHRDFPGVKKACPRFEAKIEFANIV